MRRFANILLVFAVVLASMLPAVGDIEGLVLCFSSDGHVALETTHAEPGCAELCGPASWTNDTDGVASSFEPHSCVDFALVSVDTRFDRIRVTNAHPESDWTPTPGNATGWLADPPTAAYQEPNAHNDSALFWTRAERLTALRTVILRI